MNPMTLEFSAHRIGGPDRMERHWGPWMAQVNPHPTSTDIIQLQGALVANSMIRVEITDWAYAMPGWLGAQARLSDEMGRPVGTARPVLLYTQPCDVPSYANFFDAHDGVYALGIRHPVKWRQATQEMTHDIDGFPVKTCPTRGTHGPHRWTDGAPGPEYTCDGYGTV